MPGIDSHRDLIAWQKAMDLVVRCYELTREFPKSEIYGLSSQLQRAAVSVPANIAEGHARGTRKDYAHFISIARGSAAELETLLLLATRTSLLASSEVSPLIEEVEQIARMLNRLHARLRETAA